MKEFFNNLLLNDKAMVIIAVVCICLMGMQGMGVKAETIYQSALSGLFGLVTGYAIGTAVVKKEEK